MSVTFDDFARRLAQAGIADARREARALMMAITGIDPLLSDTVPPQYTNALEEAVTRRSQRVPLSKIIGKKHFYGREFITSPDVLDPRPDSETLIEKALHHCPPSARILDLGTGSGCLLLTMLAEKPLASGVGADLSQDALDIATQNAHALGLTDRAEFVRGDFASVAFTERFDLLIANPPYIKTEDINALAPEVKDHDPYMALDGGKDGCDAYRVILARLPDFLCPDMYFVLEFAPDICDEVFRLADGLGHQELQVIPDMAGRERVLLGRCGRIVR